MAAKPIVTLTVALDGTVKVSVAGAPGASCKDITRPLERALGLTTQDTPTTEMSTQNVTQAATQRQNGS